MIGRKVLDFYYPFPLFFEETSMKGNFPQILQGGDRLDANNERDGIGQLPSLFHTYCKLISAFSFIQIQAFTLLHGIKLSQHLDNCTRL